MSQTTVNSEGLTFAEWVCAAGLARFFPSSGSVRPYTQSHTICLNPGWHFQPLKYKRIKTEHYPRKVRAAWRNGEDPTEYRTTSMYRQKELGDGSRRKETRS